jgi:hypothetical protein
VGTTSPPDLHTAPAAVPSGTVTVTATRNAQSTAKATAIVSLMPAIVFSLSTTNPSLRLRRSLESSPRCLVECLVMGNAYWTALEERSGPVVV